MSGDRALLEASREASRLGNGFVGMIDAAIARGDLAIAKLGETNCESAREIEGAINLLKTVAEIFRRECESRIAEDEAKVSSFMSGLNRGSA